MYYAPYICHHGVKGQKWGVRKKLSNAASRTKSFAKKHKTVIKTAAFIGGSIALNAFVRSQGFYAMPLPTAKTFYNDEINQGMQAIGQLNMMSKGYMPSKNGGYYKLPE